MKTNNNNRENMNRVYNHAEPEALRGATLQELERHSNRTNAPAWLRPGQTFKRTTADGREVVAICTRILLDGFAYITANGCAYTDHVKAFAAFDFNRVTPCDIDDNAPEFARMLRNFRRIRKDFEQYQTAHPYEPTATAQNEPQAALEAAQEITGTPTDSEADTNDIENREFANYERVIVTGNWGHSDGKQITEEVATVHAYDAETGLYWVIFRSGHGNGNSWHKADKLAHIPAWIKDGAQVYSLTGWRTGEPFTISNARAEVVTLTTPDGYKFRADIAEVLREFAPQA